MMLPSAQFARRLSAYPDLGDETALVASLAAGLDGQADALASAGDRARAAIRAIRSGHAPGLMESMLSEYGLNTDEGVALMCLAEAYLRTPDAETLDALIVDKIGDADWARHLGQAQSSLVNASTWALMLTGRVYKSIPAEAADLGSAMRGMIARLGEPVVRVAVAQAMRMLGQQFVLGSSIDEAIRNGAEAGKAAPEGMILHSFDMLGEAARTAADASRYFDAYAAAIRAIGRSARHPETHANNSISVKLSALHPRYETAKHARVMAELAPRLADLAVMAKQANIGLSVDAEEADRLLLSLDVIEHCLKDERLAGWPGFGVVVQAYSRRAPAVLDWLHDAARAHGRQIAVRLVKGAYWDAEIKLAQTLGLPAYPVYTRKEHTDIAYLACARKLLAMTDVIYPQFATHNALTVTAIEAMAGHNQQFEFQRLHGMGEPLHLILQAEDKRRRRIYAPVGVHRDLLAYLVRRLLENGANSSFVNQIVDETVPVDEIAADPVAKARAHGFSPHPAIPLPAAIYGERVNSAGLNLNEPAMRDGFAAAVTPGLSALPAGAAGRAITNPANRADLVGHVRDATPDEARNALDRAHGAVSAVAAMTGNERAAILDRAADLFEARGGDLMALAIREAGKTWTDAVAELREAVDFLRFYAAEARALPADAQPRGLVVSIAPWNFPLAIFTGQMAGAFAAGNTIVAKPAEQTPLVAALAVDLMHQAGVPVDGLVLVQGDGAAVGPVLTSDPRVAGIVFTGSTETAAVIDRSLAANGNPDAMLLAETGGLNAMVVDSTALLEQATRDIIASAFQSAGQRCSALRLLLVQTDIEEPLMEMLKGAIAELRIGDPARQDTDIGPVIDDEARAGILAHCARLEAEGRLVCKGQLSREAAGGTFVAPHVFRLDRVADLKREIFGPVLHVVTFRAGDLDAVIDQVNATGYGLTFAIHSRIDERVDRVCARIHAGNAYVNRNQIGAVVGVQPFGGEGLSGTGPKAGGPLYVRRFLADAAGMPLPQAGELRGPTGERNTYALKPRARVLCLGPSEADTLAQAARARAEGSSPVALSLADPDFAAKATAAGTGLALFDGEDRRAARLALAALPGTRIALERVSCGSERFLVETSVSEDTTASGGNASLLAAVS